MAWRDFTMGVLRVFRASLLSSSGMPSMNPNMGRPRLNMCLCQPLQQLSMLPFREGRCQKSTMVVLSPRFSRRGTALMLATTGRLR